MPAYLASEYCSTGRTPHRLASRANDANAAASAQPEILPHFVQQLGLPTSSTDPA
jgi:hypothetical protein